MLIKNENRNICGTGGLRVKSTEISLNLIKYFIGRCSVNPISEINFFININIFVVQLPMIENLQQTLQQHKGYKFFFQL